MDAGNDKPGKRSVTSDRALLVLMGLGALWILYRIFASPLLPAGSEPPPWELPRADGAGGLLGSEALRGDVVVLDFWATTCPPCLRQFDELDAVWRQMKSRGVTVVGIASGGETVEEVKSFLKQHPADYPIVADSGAAVAPGYRVSALPALYIIDRQGKVAASHQGFWDRESLAYAVGQVLARDRVGEGNAHE